ncbi:MAG: NlpC/P60 family protein, partial [Acidimicrobiales bacterium]
MKAYSRRVLPFVGTLLLLSSLLVVTQAVSGARAAALTSFSGQSVVNYASAATGYHYCFGGGTPNGPSVGGTDPDPDPGYYSNCNQIGAIGYDCTGLTLYAVAQASGGSVILPHNDSQASAAIADGGQVISNQADLRPGDLVYFDRNAGNGLGSIDHVGIETSSGVFSAISEKWGIGTYPISWYAAGGLYFVGGVRLWSSSGQGGPPPPPTLAELSNSGDFQAKSGIGGGWIDEQG